MNLNSGVFCIFFFRFFAPQTGLKARNSFCTSKVLAGIQTRNAFIGHTFNKIILHTKSVGLLKALCALIY